MATSDQKLFEQWKSALEEHWRGIPKQFRSPATVRATLICRLFELVEATGCRVLAGFMPPLVRDRAVDVLGIGEGGALTYAVCLDEVVTLQAVKSLSAFESDHKLILTMGALEKKVQESRFFLKPEIEHLHLKPFE